MRTNCSLAWKDRWIKWDKKSLPTTSKKLSFNFNVQDSFSLNSVMSILTYKLFLSADSKFCPVVIHDWWWLRNVGKKFAAALSADAAAHICLPLSYTWALQLDWNLLFLELCQFHDASFPSYLMQIWPGGVENLSLIGQFALEKSLKSINYLVPQNTIIYTGMNIHH